MATKVDLTKAFDQLEWSFLKHVLNLLSFPESFIKLVISCVTSPLYTILLNGAKLEPFSPSRGLRQGDPLSPNLFIICLEALVFLIEKNVKKELEESPSLS